MSFLYGDSSPSSLQGDFLELLRETLDFCVRTLNADGQVSGLRERSAALQREGDGTVARLEKLGGVVMTATQRFSVEEMDPAVEACGAAIARTAAELVRTEAARLKATLGAEVAKLDAQSAAVRSEVVKAFEGLLLRHDLPDAALRTHVRLLGGTRYGARLLVTAPFGLDATLELDVPAGHLFATAVRVDKVVERLEVIAPDAPGRLRESKPRPHRLERCFVTEFALGVTGSAIKLREAFDGTGGGFDLLFGGEDHRPRLIRVGDREEVPLTEMTEADASRLRVFCERLSAPASELMKHRKALVEATLDNQPLATLERPAQLVERIVQHLAPIVREIAARSSSPGELVLRRLLSEDRREEIFLSKSELRRKLEPLPPTQRGIFTPLGLETGAS